MARFLFPINIANRGLQHIGATRIDETLGFDEPSKAASECGFVYDKLRRAELQRNVWTFAIRRAALRPVDTTTMLLVPALWSDTATYFIGSIVVDQYGTMWISDAPDNLNNDPLSTPAWQQYFGPLSVMAWDSTTSYFAGELVYTAAGDGTNRVYLSLQEANSDNPATATAWSATATYFKNQIITRSSVAYMSRIDLNLNQDPATTFFAEWASGTTYAAAAKVTGSDGVLYTSVGSGNIAHDPTTDGGVHWTSTGVLSPWDSTFVAGTGSIKWLQIGGAEAPSGVTVAPLGAVITYPVGAGPSSQTITRNIFRLPAGFLRKAPQNPKAGSFSLLGSPTNAMADDWLFQDQYIVSAFSTTIVLRFVADTVDVMTFHDMFCEGLGARIGLEVCEPLSQSTSKKQAAASEYQKFMGEARTVNAIEAGSEEPALDDYLACRY